MRTARPVAGRRHLLPAVVAAGTSRLGTWDGTKGPAPARLCACLLAKETPGGSMKQRVHRRAWRSVGRAGHRPRVLIEDDHPALAISDLSMFKQAGFDVAFCSGPGRDLAACPLLCGRPCPILAGADAVLHGLDPGLGVAAAIRRHRPGVPVVAGQRRHADGSLQPVPEGCTPQLFPSSVKGQIDALWQVLLSPPV